MLNLGLIGCGSIAQLVYLSVLPRLPGVALTALAETDRERLAAAARRAPGARTFADGEALLAQADVDAVIICLPSALHAALAVAAFTLRKHVYLEKPLAIDLASGRRVLEAWRRAGRVGVIGFNYRYNALYMDARSQVASGCLGGLIAARTIFTTAQREVPEWKRARRSGGGALLDLGSHHADLIRYLFGQEITSVSAWLRSQRVEDDGAAVSFYLADGLVVQSLFALGTGDEDRVEIFGQDRRLAVDRYRSFGLEFGEPLDGMARARRAWRAAKAAARSPYLRQRLFAPGNEPSYEAALRHFVAAIHGNVPASPNLDDGYRSLAVVLAAEESAQTGQTVTVRYD